MKNILPIGILGLAMLCGCSKSGPPTKTVSYPIGTNDQLTLTFPATWTNDLIPVREVGASESKTFDGIRFTPTNSEPCAFLIELVPAGDTNAERLDLRSLLLKEGGVELANSVETNLEIHDVQGAQTSGYYFRLTDRRYTNAAPPTNEFKSVVQGFSRLSPLVLSYRLVFDDPKSEAEALDVIRTAKITKP